MIPGPLPVSFTLEISVTTALSHSLAAQGIETAATIHPNLTSEELTAAALERGEGRRAKDGARRTPPEKRRAKGAARRAPREGRHAKGAA